MGLEGEVVQKLIPQFERENPDLHVVVQALPWSAAHEKLLTAYVGGSLPDASQLGNTWMAEFTALNALEPLRPYLQQSTALKDSTFFKGIFETNVLDGMPYGLPWYVDTRLLFYRKDLLSQAGYDHPPRDWAEWMTMMRAIKQRVGKDRYAILAPLNEFETLLILGLQQPEGLLRDRDQYGNFQSAGFRKAFRFYLDWFRNDLAPGSSNNAIGNVHQEFGRGLFSFYITGPWNISEFKKRLPAELQSTWMTAPVPGPNGEGVSTAGGASLVVFKSSPNKTAAWKWLSYLSRPDVQVKFHDLTGDLPANVAAWNDPLLAQNPYAVAFRDQLMRTKPTPLIPEWERIVTKMREYAEAVVKGVMTEDEALRKLDAATDQMLEKRRWLLSRR